MWFKKLHSDHLQQRRYRQQGLEPEGHQYLDPQKNFKANAYFAFSSKASEKLLKDRAL